MFAGFSMSATVRVGGLGTAGAPGVEVDGVEGEPPVGEPVVGAAVVLLVVAVFVSEPPGETETEPLPVIV